MRELCLISDVKNTGLTKVLPDGKEVVLVSHQGKIFAYLNLCPHAFAKLDAFGESIIGFDQYHIICTVHGALFRPSDGYCVNGPCKGRSLSKVSVIESEGKVWLTEEDDI